MIVYGNRSTSQGIKLQNHLLKDCSYSTWSQSGKIYPITYKVAPLDMSNIPMCCLGDGIYMTCSKQWICIFTWMNSAFSFVLQSYSETLIVLLCTLQFVRVTLCFHHPGQWALWGLWVTWVHILWHSEWSVYKGKSPSQNHQTRSDDGSKHVRKSGTVSLLLS